MFKHRCEACGRTYESRWAHDTCMNCRRVTAAIGLPENPYYLAAPFTAEWGTQEWIDDAKRRCERAMQEYIQAANALAAETDLQLVFVRQHNLELQADVLIRAKWLQREIVRATERLVTPIVVEKA